LSLLDKKQVKLFELLLKILTRFCPAKMHLVPTKAFEAILFYKPVN
jgi:hypothetical protein